MLVELAETPWPSREEALATAETLGRVGWAWAEAVVNALRSKAVREGWRGNGVDPWTRIPEWEDQAPLGEPGSKPVEPEAARARLAELLARVGLDEARPAQVEFAAETTYAFQPRDREGEPNLMLAEAGTGVGKTLAYLAPASLLRAEANGPSVWVSTFTRALQRQIERESHALYPDPEVCACKAVVRKGARELPVPVEPAGSGGRGHAGRGGDLIGTALAARWARATRDGDMTGGDFPAWPPGLFGGQSRGPGQSRQSGRPPWRMRTRRLPALPRLLHRKGGAGLAARRHRHRQPRPGADPGGVRRRARGAGPENRCGDHRAKADRVRRGPPSVRRGRRGVFGGAVGGGGGGAAPLDPRAGGARPSNT